MKLQSASSRNAFFRKEWNLAPGELPLAGAHIVVTRTGYSHHGIHIGQGRVVHYAGLSRGWSRGPIEEISLERFADGRPVMVRSHVTPRFDTAEIVERARSRIGEAAYDVVTNNCEHFCEWCIRGENRSEQVETVRSTPARLLRAIGKAIGRFRDGWLNPESGMDGWAV